MNLFRLAYFLKLLTPKIENINGYLFFGDEDLGADGLEFKTRKYASLPEAQSWMNIVLLDDFIDEAVGDEWSADDPSVNNILSIFESAWSYQIGARFPGAEFVIDRLRDDEAGDLGLRLRSLAPCIGR